MDLEIEAELSKLNAKNFQKASDFRETMEHLLFKRELNDAEIRMVTSKIIMSDHSFLNFLHTNCDNKDHLLAETRKTLFKILARFIKTYKDYMYDHLETLFGFCFKIFIKEDSNKVKQAALEPIQQIIKLYNQKQIPFFNPKESIRQLLDQLKSARPVANVKKSIFATIGKMIHYFNDKIENEQKDIKYEAIMVAWSQLRDQLESSKSTEIAIICGLLQFFKHALIPGIMNQEQLSILFKCLWVLLQDIQDVKGVKVIILDLKCLTKNIEIFDQFLLAKSRDLFNQLTKLLNHNNRDVKENASELFEKFINIVSQKLQQDQQHKILFNQILDKFCDILGAEEKNMFVLTVVIRSVGKFSAAIKTIRGEIQLMEFFNNLIELSEESVLTFYENYHQEQQENRDLKKGQSLKAVLYRQKQLSSFILSYGSLIQNLNFLTDKQALHLYQICLTGFKLHYNYFDAYRQYLYEGLTNMILSLLSYHQIIASQFIDKLIFQGIEEGLQNYNDYRTYMSTCYQMGNLFSGIFKQKNWANASLNDFGQHFFKIINQILNNTTFDHRVQRDEEDEQNLQGQGDYKNFISNPAQYTILHRVILVISQCISDIPVYCAVDSIILLLRNVYQKLQKYPKAILLLLFGRVLMKYVQQHDLCYTEYEDIKNNKKNYQIHLKSILSKLMHLTITNLRGYSNQIQIEALSMLMCIPLRFLINEQYGLLKQKYLVIFQQALKIGQSSLPLSYYSVDKLIQLISSENTLKNQANFKNLLKILKPIIPLLSQYMQIQQKDEIYVLDKIQYIDQIPFKNLLCEKSQSQEDLVKKVQYFLGSIGGLCHMIVEQNSSEPLLALDYNSPIVFLIPIGQKILKIRIGNILQKILDITQNASTDKLKVLGGELLHSLIMYMIGKSAKESSGGFGNKQEAQERANKAKQDYAVIYKRIFPVLLQISCSNSSPNKILFSNTLIQIARWFSNSSQHDAPDVSQLIESVLEQPIKDQNKELEQLSGQIIGEFVKWTIKQRDQKQLQSDYYNIKTVIQRITTFVNHPDIRYKSMGLECIKQVALYAKTEQFLVEKYFLELCRLLKLVNGCYDKIDTIVDHLSEGIRKFNMTSSEIRRSGKYKNLQQLQQFLFEEATSGKDGQWQQIALKLWFTNLGDKNLRQSIQEFAKPTQYKFFTQHNDLRIQFCGIQFQEDQFLIHTEQLAWQFRIWGFFLENAVFTINELNRFNDFKATCDNVMDFLDFFIQIKQYKKKPQSSVQAETSLSELLQSLSQEAFNPSQIIEGGVNSFVLSDNLANQFISTLERCFTFGKQIRIHEQLYQQVGCVLLFKPSYFFHGITVELFQAQLESLNKIVFSVLNFQLRIIIQTLNYLFDSSDITAIILSQDTFKEIVELKIFLNSLKKTIDQCYSQEANQFLIQAVQDLGNKIQQREEKNELQLDVERSQILIEFAFNSQRADQFVLQQLASQSNFKRRYEKQLLDYIVQRFESLGKDYFEAASENRELLRYSIQIVKLLEKYEFKGLDSFYRSNFKVERKFLILTEIQLNYLILMQCSNNCNHQYMDDLLKDSLSAQYNIEVHKEALLLLGLYCKLFDYQSMKILSDIRNKYFPIRIDDLKKDSQQEINFNYVVKTINDMIKLSGKIQLVEILFPLIRQNMDFTQFINDYIRDNFSNNQGEQIDWIFMQIQDQSLDRNHFQNLRVELGYKLLIPMLTNSTYIKQFFIQNISYIMNELTFKFSDLWENVIFDLSWHSFLCDLLSVCFKYLPSEIIKIDIHNSYTKNSQGNEITQKIIKECVRIRKTKFEKLHILEQKQDYQKTLYLFKQSAFVLLIYVMMATQTKENLFVQFVFKYQQDKELFWEQMIPSDWEFNFQVETKFQEQNLNEFIKQQQNKFTQQVAQRYFATSAFNSYESQNQVIIQYPDEEIIQDQKPQARLELDAVNSHKVMIPFLQLIDFMDKKFANQAQGYLPQWMTELYNQLEKPASLPIRIFLIKVILNKEEIFYKYAGSWLSSLLQYCSKNIKPNGGQGFHYFLRDVVLAIIKFSDNDETRDNFIQNQLQAKELICSAANNLLTKTCLQNKNLFEVNLQLFEGFCERFRKVLYFNDDSLNKMIQSKDKQDSELWQINGLQILRIAFKHNIIICSDFVESQRLMTRSIFDQYRYLIQGGRGYQAFPSKHIISIASKYETKKAIIQGIAQVYGQILLCCDKLKANEIVKEYEYGAQCIAINILNDTRPGYGKERFTDFIKQLTLIYPKILDNSVIFQKTCELIILATSLQRASILTIFESYLKYIENYTNEAQFQINNLVMTVQGAINKILDDIDIQVHFALLNFLKQIVSLKCMNLCTEVIMSCCQHIIPKLQNKLGTHHEKQIVERYQEILVTLHEYLLNYDNQALYQIVTEKLLQTFTSKFIEIRKKTFEYFLKDLDKKVQTRQYKQNREQTMMDRIISLMKDIYQPNQEPLWLKSAVPLILSQSKRSSEYDKYLFDKPLSEEVKFYEKNFKSKQYQQQMNVTQYNFATQFVGSIVSQAQNYFNHIVRATQLQVEEQIQPQFNLSVSRDTDGYVVPKGKTQLSQFAQANQLTYNQVQLTQNQKIRFLPENQGSIRETAKIQYEKQKDKNSFELNKVRSYRTGDLPDIMIKLKDILDPLIEICFEDEETSGVLFTILFEELQEENQNIDILLIQLLEASTQKTFTFISTILKTLYQVTRKSGKLFQPNSIIKNVGLESFAVYQSMILVEEGLQLIDLDPELDPLSIVRQGLWMDLIDLNQFQPSQVQGILNTLFNKDADISKNLRKIFHYKSQSNFKEAEQHLRQFRDQCNEQFQHQNIDRESVDARMMKFLNEEYEDILRKLGQWDQVDINLQNDVIRMTPLELQRANPLEVRRVLQRCLTIQEDREPDIQIAAEIHNKLDSKLLVLKDQCSFEIAQLLQTENDTDRAVFYLEKSQKMFLNKWSQLLNQNPLLSKDLRHSHLEQLQLMHELKEFQTIFKGGQIDNELRDRIFESWQYRAPSVNYDSISTWHRVYQSRRLMASQFENINQYEANWAVQIANGFMKKSLYDQVVKLLGYSYQLLFKQVTTFNWQFFSTFSKSQLKQFEQQIEQMDKNSLFDRIVKDIGTGEYKDVYLEHLQYIELLTTQYHKRKNLIKIQEIDFKFRYLIVQFHENYVRSHQDFIFIINQKTKDQNYHKNIDQYLWRYADQMNHALKQYESMSQEVFDDMTNTYQKFYKNAASFCERCLRLIEPDSGGSDVLRNQLDSKGKSIQLIANQFVQYSINSFKVQKIFDQKSNLLVKVLKVVQKFPTQIGETFQSAVKKGLLPTWIFLRYLSQIMHILNDPKLIDYFKRIFKNLVQKYPEQFLYQFNVNFEKISDCKIQKTQQIFTQLRKKIPRNYEFMKNLNQLTHPQHRYQYYLQQLLEGNNIDFQQVYDDLFQTDPEVDMGALNVNFAKKYENQFKQFQLKYERGMDISKELKEYIDKFKNSEQSNIKTGNYSLSDLSKWFANFKDHSDDDFLGKKQQEISIPLKLTVLDEYDLQVIPKIASFDQKMLVLTSMRRPKRIKIYGTDEKTYMFLVKGIEDLRLDQRIEQMFDVMNSLHDKSQISTFAVIPMSKLLGLLEWVDQTSVLKEILEREFQEINPGMNLHNKNGAYNKRLQQLKDCAQRCGIWNRQQLEQLINGQQLQVQPLHQALLLENSQEIVKQFNEQQSFIPSNLLRLSLLKMSVSLEAFVFIRDRFISNYAVCCAAGYILGIGDRHLENFLLNYVTGEIVLIDFGYSFGSSLNLPIPELLPFRLTQVFEGLSKPIGLNGIYKHEFVALMSELRNKRHIILDYCEVFINDPLLDQIKLAKDRNSQYDKSQMEKQLRYEESVYQGSDEQSSRNNVDIAWYPWKKIQIVRKKLMGYHPSDILLDELEDSRHSRERYTKNLIDVIRGKDRVTGLILSVADQVECLMDIARDPNILGRTWMGWMPYI